MKSKGFTLIELLIVITILSILAIIGFAVLGNSGGKVRNARRKADVDVIAKAYEAKYDSKKDQYSMLVEASDFVGGKAPHPPENSNGNYEGYNVGFTNGKADNFLVCAKLEGAPVNTTCSPSNTYCYCRASSQGTSVTTTVNGQGTPVVAAPARTATPALSQTSLPPLSPADLADAYSPKVLLLIYNPIIESQGGRRLTEVKAWNDPAVLTNTFINSMSAVSRGFVNYRVAETIVLDAYPVHEVDPADPLYVVNGFVYDDASYLACVASLPGGQSCYKPNQGDGAGYLADYRRMIQAADACTKRNNGTIDELWIWGGPGFGFWESNLAGPGAFYYNSGPTTGTTCNKLLPIMGFNYEVPEARMWEDFAHRTESTMTMVFDITWTAGYDVISATAQNDWDRFTILDSQSPGNGGCGNAHTSVNSLLVSEKYDWTSTNTTRSNCRNFANYPNLGGTTENINCNVWGCTDLGYFKDWFFKYLPINPGSNNGKLNNWWKYLVDPQGTFISGS